MRLFEISNKSRKIIKTLERLYIKYMMSGKGSDFQVLVNLITDCENSTDKDIINECYRYDSLLKEDIINILKS